MIRLAAPGAREEVPGTFQGFLSQDIVLNMAWVGKLLNLHPYA
jgi:hypothetical protein